MMIRRISTFIVIIVCFVLQTTLFQQLKLAHVVPNLMMIITVSIAYMRGRSEGIIVGLFCGLLFDMMYGSVIGLYGFIFMSIGFFVGYVKILYYTESAVVPVILVFTSEFAYGIYYYVMEFLLRGRLHFWFYFLHRILPEIIYTTLISFFLFGFLRFLERRLSTRKGEV